MLTNIVASKSAINDMIIDGNGDVFLVSDAHLHRLSAGAWTTEVIQEAGEALAMGPDGSVYLGTRMGGVFKVGEGEWNSMDLAAGLPFERIDDLEFGPDGSMYLGTDNGAWRFDGNQWESFLPEDALRSDEVRLIAVGMDNTIWFGGLGLARFGAPLSQ